MPSPTFNTFPHRPALNRGQKEASFTTPPEPGAAPYPGSMRTSDRATIEALSGSPRPAFPGSGIPGEPWKRPRAPNMRGVRR